MLPGYLPRTRRPATAVTLPPTPSARYVVSQGCGVGRRAGKGKAPCRAASYHRQGDFDARRDDRGEECRSWFGRAGDVSRIVGLRSISSNADGLAGPDPGPGTRSRRGAVWCPGPERRGTSPVHVHGHLTARDRARAAQRGRGQANAGSAAPKTPAPGNAAVDANRPAKRRSARIAPDRVSTRRLGNATVATKADAKTAIVSTLRDNGGRLEGASVRGLATLIGAHKSNVHNALTALIAAGAVAKIGTALVLQA